MEGLLLLLLFPLAWPFIAKRIWHYSINWTEMTIQIFVVSILTVGVWQLGVYGQTVDTEIWNGYVTSKDRDHGHYIRSYSCNCVQSCSGSGSSRSCTQICQTCYEDHYTVKWTANTTVGNITFKSLDRTSRSVYNTPNPRSYEKCVVGEPVAQERNYENLVQAVPDSLFNTTSGDKTYKKKVPSYPKVYDFYRINRVLLVDANYPQAIVLNNALNNELKHLGKSKQVNLVVVITEIDDPSYRYAVEREWLGGEKNDVVLFFGVDGTKITWVDVMTWALNKGNELFHVTMRDGLKNIGDISKVDQLTPFISKTISELYDRPQMKDFENLRSAIDPPTWVIIIAIIVAIGGSLGLTWTFHRYEVNDIIHEGFKALGKKIRNRNGQTTSKRNGRNNG